MYFEALWKHALYFECKAGPGKHTFCTNKQDHVTKSVTVVRTNLNLPKRLFGYCRLRNLMMKVQSFRQIANTNRN